LEGDKKMTTKQELKQHICELREIVTKKQEWEEKYLKEEYGKGWVVMIRCQAGRGYEICQEILDAINEIEEKEKT